MLLCSTAPRFFLCAFLFLTVKLFLVEDDHLGPCMHQSQRHFRQEGWIPVWAYIYYREKSFPLEDHGQTLSSEYTEHVQRAGWGLRVKLCPRASRFRGFSMRQSSPAAPAGRVQVNLVPAEGAGGGAEPGRWVQEMSQHLTELARENKQSSPAPCSPQQLLMSLSLRVLRIGSRKRTL